MVSDTPPTPEEEELPEEDLPVDLEELSEEEVAAPAEEEEEGREEGEEEEEELLFRGKKAPTRDAVREALEWAFAEEEAPAGFLDRCAEHALLVYAGSKRMNLTKIFEPREVAAKHYLDCWRATRMLPLLGKRVLDIGTGAGFPGVPLALAEENTSVDMMDSTKKKADFVASCVETMAIPNASCTWGRAEEHLLRNKYDVCIMRAISSVRENVRLLRKVRHQFHDLVMLKGPSWSREVRAGEREAERLGFRLDTILEHELPGEMGARAVLVYRAPGGRGR